MTAAQGKSLSARKATRKTYTAAESLEISLRNNEVLQEHIAALEAELEVELQKRRNLLDSFNEQVARAEKAEADVERLKVENDGLSKMLAYFPKLQVEAAGRLLLRERGGREETPGGGTSPSGVSPSPPPAAAEPAAPRKEAK